MSGSGQNLKRESRPSSWLESLVRHILYGFTIIRQEGLVYFFSRIYQSISWQAIAIYQSIRNKTTRQDGARFFKVDDLPLDIQPVSVLEDLSTLPRGKEQATGSLIPSDHHTNLIRLGITCHNQHIPERQAIIEKGCEHYSNRRVLFVSPIRVLGGGANLIFLITSAMRRMGVDAQVMNLHVHKRWFEKNYPGVDVPVIFADIKDIPQLAAGYDAIIATSNPTVAWIAPASLRVKHLAIGYYIQDYEPYFYPQGSHEFQRARASYTRVLNLIRMVTTPWIADQIRDNHAVHSDVVGAHMDVDLFLPHSRPSNAMPDRPIRIAAMIRPTTVRRNPKLTMAILQQASKMYGSKVEIVLFGCNPTDPGFASLEKDFKWKLAGQLRTTQMANLLNGADIFVDYSEFQALGLTALESMACGVAAIVPAKGGTNVYARHNENCLVVDTGDQEACLAALQRLVEDDDLRVNLQLNAISTAARFFPEAPALNMLNVLFAENK